MFKIIFYLIIIILLLHFTLYYFNFDFDISRINYFKSNKDKENKNYTNIQTIVNTIELNQLKSKEIS